MARARGEKEKGRHERDRGGVGAIARVSRDANEKTPFVSSSSKKEKEKLDSEKDKKIEDFSDKELEEIIDARIQMGKEKVDILIKYHEKFKEVIPIRKLAKYYQASKEFKKIQSERKKQHNNPGERKR